MINSFRHSRSSLFYVALIALSMSAMPLAASPSRMMNIQLCSADGEMRSISIPLGQDDGNDEQDCAKPCHACLSRNKVNGKASKS